MLDFAYTDMYFKQLKIERCLVPPDEPGTIRCNSDHDGFIFICFIKLGGFQTCVRAGLPLKPVAPTPNKNRSSAMLVI